MSTTTHYFTTALIERFYVAMWQAPKCGMLMVTAIKNSPPPQHITQLSICNYWETPTCWWWPYMQQTLPNNLNLVHKINSYDLLCTSLKCLSENIKSPQKMSIWNFRLYSCLQHSFHKIGFLFHIIFGGKKIHVQHIVHEQIGQFLNNPNQSCNKKLVNPPLLHDSILINLIVTL